MSIALYRIDDRLIHGQVVVGWGQPLDLRFIVLVDDNVAGSEWEQELYRMGVPPEMAVHFATVADAAGQLARFEADPQPGIVLVGDVATMQRLVIASAGRIHAVNIGGVHHQAGRTGRMRYVFLTPAEETGLREIAALGVAVTAQDVPGARPVPLAELLQSTISA
ncbi:MAG: PTS sugar transporter subunit IIB [Gemmatimonadetes bacterium]|nr:PTS sugar transporter subunit IIB [Gemmatimonadota bacterium]